MKVADLIVALEGLDPELPVLIPSLEQAGFAEVAAVAMGYVAPSVEGGFDAVEAPEGAGAAILFEPGE